MTAKDTIKADFEQRAKKLREELAKLNRAQAEWEAEQATSVENYLPELMRKLLEDTTTSVFFFPRFGPPCVDMNISPHEHTVWTEVLRSGLYSHHGQWKRVLFDEVPLLVMVSGDDPVLIVRFSKDLEDLNVVAHHIKPRHPEAVIRWGSIRLMAERATFWADKLDACLSAHHVGE